MRETRPRKYPIKEFKEDDPNFTLVPHGAIIGEIDAVVDQYGHIYISKEYSGKKVKLLIYR